MGGGGGLDVPGTGGRPSSDAGADLIPHDSVLADGGQPCLVGNVTYQPGQSFVIDCVTFTCVSGSNVTVRGATCADAAGPGGMTGTGGATADGGGAGMGGNGGSTASGPTLPDGGNCGAMELAVFRAPADVLLVLDRSGSMQYSLAGDCDCSAATGGSTGSICPDTTNCTDRWTAVKSAVSQAIANNPSIQWGLKLFSTPGGSAACSLTVAPEVPIGASSRTAVQAQLDSCMPGGNTPTASAIVAATAYLRTLSDGNSKAILLATDGEPNCGGGQSTNSDVQGTVDAITAASSAGFPVYVIGVGPSVGNLDTMAMAGGTGSSYPATSTQQLSDAFAGIANGVATCSFALAQTPDSSNAYVYVDKRLVPQDGKNGWIFGATTSTIVFTGSYCDDLKAGQTTIVQILQGCPGVAPPAILP